MGAAGSHGDRHTYESLPWRRAEVPRAGWECAAAAYSRHISSCATFAGSPAAMNREEHFYAPEQMYKEPYTYQAPADDDYSQSPPPCLYMGRQTPVCPTPSLGSLDPPCLSNTASYDMPLMREDPGVSASHAHLLPTQMPQHTHQSGVGYGSPADLVMVSDRNQYQLPFPWMKSTKSHTHTWKGQWTGNAALTSAGCACRGYGLR